jgi:two-component system chemotaxis response regulator CheY
MRALVVDDSRAMRALLHHALAGLGYEVLEAPGGREGLETLAREGGVDVVLVDWNMEGMDGLEFVRALRAQAAHARLPVMMVTTEVEPASVEKALKAGCQEYLMKPFTPEMLADKLTLLGLPR